MKVDVLGTQYSIVFREESKDDILQTGNGLLGGYCLGAKSLIVINKTYFDDSPKEVIERTVRHELVHAFLYESGLDSQSFAENEEIVDWISFQCEKIFNAIKEYRSKTSN